MLNNPISAHMTNIRRKIIITSASITSINKKPVTKIEREYLANMEKAKKRRVIEGQQPMKHQSNPPSQESPDYSPKVVPHLPAYASQYRDMMLQQLSKDPDDPKRRAKQYSTIHLSSGQTPFPA